MAKQGLSAQGWGWRALALLALGACGEAPADGDAQRSPADAATPIDANIDAAAADSAAQSDSTPLDAVTALDQGGGSDLVTAADRSAGDGAALDAGALLLAQVEPARGGASVATRVRLTGSGFGAGLEVRVGGVAASDVAVASATEAQATFQPVALTERGVKDVEVLRGGHSALLPAAFEYLFDEDPIVFVHGYLVDAGEWATMLERFRELGYPDEQLFAISYSSSTQSNVINARDELAPFVDQVLAQTESERVDIIAHSNGGMSTRLWIGQHGGGDKVRDYVSLAGTHHGTSSACLGWPGDSAREQCPPYAQEAESVNGVQWLLNGDPDSADVDETPFGVEDGGGIAYHALWTEDDLIDVPPHTCCLNQSARGDCTDPVNVAFSGVGHMEMVTDQAVFELTRDLVRLRNQSRP